MFLSLHSSIIIHPWNELSLSQIYRLKCTISGYIHFHSRCAWVILTSLHFSVGWLVWGNTIKIPSTLNVSQSNYIKIMKNKIGTISHPVKFWKHSKGSNQKKKREKSGQADHLGWPPPSPPPKRSGKCEIFWLLFLTLYSDYIRLETNFTPKKYFLTTDPPLLPHPPTQKPSRDIPWYPRF